MNASSRETAKHAKAAPSRQRASRAQSAASAPAAPQGRQLILDTAARLFRTGGYASTSLRDIAAEAGMKAASLYSHFSSKDAIVSEVLQIGVQRVFDHVRNTVDALPADVSPQLLLQAAIHSHLEGMLALQDYTSANIRIFGQVTATIREAHLPTRDTYERYWVSILARCAKCGPVDKRRDLRLARLFLIGAMNGTLDWFQGGAVSLKAVADELGELILNGLLTRPLPAPAGRKAAPATKS
jgi:AcrR family transcriptional regulator